MAYQTIYKDIGFSDETSFGATGAGTTKRVHVKTVTLNKVPTKTLVEDTITSVKGRDRMYNQKDEVTGDITGSGSPAALHFALASGLGVAGATAALGTSALTVTYNQNTSGNLLSRTVNLDRNNSQERFIGVIGTGIQLTCSDNTLEWTLPALAKDVHTGVSMADTVNETASPYTFADFTVTINPSGSANQLNVSEWSIDYQNGAEASWLSGSRTVARIDPKIPTLTGKLKIFHENGSSWTSPVYGCSDLAIRIQGTLPTCGGVVSGTTAYTLTIDIPRTQFTSNVRNYAQSEFAVEDIDFTGYFSTGSSALLTVTQVLPLGI